MRRNCIYFRSIAGSQVECGRLGSMARGECLHRCQQAEPVDPAAGPTIRLAVSRPRDQAPTTPCAGCPHAGRVMLNQPARTSAGIAVSAVSVHCRAAGACNAPQNRISLDHACPLGRWSGAQVDAR